MKVLQLSSLLFLINVIYSYYLQNIIYHHFTLFITIFSILNHGYRVEEINIIKYIDKLLAHLFYLYIVIHETPIIFIYNQYIIIYPILLANIYLSEFIFPKYYIIIHLFFHIFSVISICIYLNNLSTYSYSLSSIL